MTTDSTNQLDRILPLPYLPTYIARRPVKTKLNSEITTQGYSPIYTTNWQNASDNHAAKYWNCYGSPYINIELESIHTSPKQYDSYKQILYPQNELNSIDSLNRIRPLTVPNHITKTSEKWSRFLDEYSDRFKIQYPLADDDNDLYVQKRPGRYSYQINQESSNVYMGLTSRIQPVSNPFRKFDSKQKSMSIHPIWIPNNTASRPYQKPRQT